MERYKKIELTTFLVIGFVTFVLLLNTYYQAPDVFMGKSIIIKGEIPESAKHVQYIEDDVIYNGIFYGYDEEVSPHKVNGLWFFEKKSLDEVRFTAKFRAIDMLGQKTEALIFIRGINYSELPDVHDYQAKVTIETKDLGIFNWYEQMFYMSEKPPWTVVTKYVKNSPLTGVGASFFAAIIIGFASAIVVTAIQWLVDQKHKTKSNKTEQDK